MIQLGDLIVILDLHRQGLSISAIARRTGRDPKTVRKYIERGLEPPAYSPRQVGRPSKLAPYLDYVRERVTAFPELSAVRLNREIRERGYTGANTAVKRFVAAMRPENGPKPFEVRFETPAGQQAQVDFARFVTEFTDEPGVTRIVWLSSLVLGHSRFIFARYVMHQDLQTLLRCHMQGFAAIGGVPIEILYDRVKMAVTGEDPEGHVVYNRSLQALAKHYGFHPHAIRALLRLERRVGHDGLVSIGGNYYSVSDRTRRVVEVHQLPDVIRILDQGRLVATHRILEGRRKTRTDPSYRQGGSRVQRRPQDEVVVIGRVGERAT